jgi:hypothetical protein
MKTRQTILCGLFAVIIALLTFAACDILGTESDGKGPDNVNGTDPDGTDPGDGRPGDGSQTGNTHTHQWGAWEATELTGTEERVCADNPAHIEARLTGTTRFTFEAISGAAAYSVSKGTAIIGTVRIPAYYRPSAEVEFHPVAAIGNEAFYNCTSLTGISIPACVTTIGSGAFYGCIILSGIAVDINNPNYTGEDGILYNKAKTELIAFPSASGNITIPSNVTTIGNNTFSGRTSLTSITIPASVTAIGSNAFAYCTGLTSITIPASVTSIGIAAFNNWTNSQTIYVLWSSGDRPNEWYEWYRGCYAQIVYQGE